MIILGKRESERSERIYLKILLIENGDVMPLQRDSRLPSQGRYGISYLCTEPWDGKFKKKGSFPSR